MPEPNADLGEIIFIIEKSIKKSKITIVILDFCKKYYQTRAARFF
jgi:hypothetical protein